MADTREPTLLDRRRLNRLRVVAVLGLVLFTPALLLVTAVGFLLLAGAPALDGLTAVELVELYLVELLVFAGSAYLLYRLVDTAVAVQLPRPGDEGDSPERPVEGAR